MSIEASLYQRTLLVENHINLGNLPAAEAEALVLYQDSYAYAQTSLNDSEVPFPTTLKAIEILTEDAIQFSLPLKKAMSMASAILSHQVLVKAKYQHLHIYPSTQAALTSRLSQLLLTTRKDQITTRFFTKCSIAAISQLTPADGAWAEIGRKHVPQLIGAVGSAGAAQSAGAIPVTVISLATDIYHAKAVRYCSVLDHRRSLMSMHSLEALGDPRNAAYLTCYSEDTKKAVCITEFFAHTVKHFSNDQALVDRVVKGNEDLTNHENALQSLLKIETDAQPCLFTLARACDEKKGFWKARYKSIELLLAISNQQECTYKVQIHALLALRLILERHKETALFLYDSYKKLDPQSQNQWKKVIRLIQPDAMKERDSKIKAFFQQRVARIKEKQSEQQPEITNLIRQINEASQESAGSLTADTPKELDKLKHQLREKEAEQQRLQGELTNEEGAVSEELGPFEESENRAMKLLKEFSESE